MVFKGASAQHRLRNALGASDAARAKRDSKHVEKAISEFSLTGCRHVLSKTGLRCGKSVVENRVYCEEHL